MQQFNDDFGNVFKSLQRNCKGIYEKQSIEKIYNYAMKCIDYYFKNNYIESEKIDLI